MSKDHTQHKFLQVSVPGRHHQGIQSTKLCEYQRGGLGITLLKY